MRSADQVVRLSRHQILIFKTFLKISTAVLGFWLIHRLCIHVSIKHIAVCLDKKIKTKPLDYYVEKFVRA